MSLLEEFPIQVESTDIKDRLAEIPGGEGEEALPVALTHAKESVKVLTEVLNVREQRAMAPSRRKGHACLDDLESFVAYVNRHKNDTSVIFADPDQVSLTTYFNYHPEGGKEEAAGWCDFYAYYGCPIAPEWERWQTAADVWMPSEAFAEFIDANMDELTTGEGFPKPVEVLEMARNLQVHTKGTFAKKVDPTTGGYAMVCKEEHAEGSTKIHRAFRLALRVFEGGAQYGVEARIKFRINSGAPSFCYTLHRAEEIKRDAFKAVHVEASAETELPTFVGRRGVR